MKRLMMTVAALVLVLAVLFSTMLITSAEAVEPRTDAEDEASVVTVEEDGGRAYQLVWKYATFDGHLWKRRWNATLGEWYDPEWILVY